MDGLDAKGQSFLQFLEDVAARAVGGRVVQQLLKRLQLNQDHHVLQKVALDIGSKVGGFQKLRRKYNQEYPSDGNWCIFY